MTTSKTAICISGLPREASMTWKSTTEMVLNNFADTDVFVHSGTSYPDGLFAGMNLRGYLVEQQFVHDEMQNVLRAANYHDESHLNAFIQQAWGLKRVWDIKSQHERNNGFKYDYVMRLRPDCFWYRPVTVDMFDLDVINSLHRFGNRPFDCFTMEFAFGPDHLMEKYFTLYDWIFSGWSKWLVKDNPRISRRGNMPADVVMTICLADAYGLKLHNFDGDPYDHYRIAYRQLAGAYEKDGYKPLGIPK